MSHDSEDLPVRLAALQAAFASAVAAATDLETLQSVRDRFLGRRSGELTALLKGLGGLAPEARREAGQQLNRTRDAFEAALEAARARLESEARERRLRAERVDVSLPGWPYGTG
jgi:phenylalanyl-tRNA synthetase alpha chain